MRRALTAAPALLSALILAAALPRAVPARDSLQPVADWLTSMGVKDSSEPCTAQSPGKLPMPRLAVKKEVEDRAIEACVSGLTDLGRLSLDGTSVTDQGLAHPESCTSLRTVTGRDRKITDAGVAAPSRALPRVKVTKQAGTGPSSPSPGSGPAPRLRPGSAP